MVEEEWNDGEIFIVAFETIDFRRINKILVFPAETEKKDVESLLIKKFTSVRKLISVDDWGDCLVDRAM